MRRHKCRGCGEWCDIVTEIFNDSVEFWGSRGECLTYVDSSACCDDEVDEFDYDDEEDY